MNVDILDSSDRDPVYLVFVGANKYQVNEENRAKLRRAMISNDAICVVRTLTHGLVEIAPGSVNVIERIGIFQ